MTGPGAVSCDEPGGCSTGRDSPKDVSFLAASAHAGSDTMPAGGSAAAELDRPSGRHFGSSAVIGDVAIGAR